MAKENWNACFVHVLGSEGGYQADPNDRGNWTSGKINQGTLKGTNWGISAMSYPTLDIANLTKADAQAIYKRDYWDKTECDLLPWGVDLCVFDSAVNSGPGAAARWLQRAVLVPVDEDIGQATVAAANATNAHTIIDRMCDDRLAYLKALPSWTRYGGGWNTRVKNVRADAHSMQKFRPGPVAGPQVTPSLLVVNIEIDAPPEVTVKIRFKGEDA